MQNKLILCLAISLLGSASFAQVAPQQAPTVTATPLAVAKINYSLRQIIKSHNLVVIESSAPVIFDEGKIFLATMKDGTQCSLTLKETSGVLLTLDSSSCDKAEQLTINTPVEPALISTVPKATVQAAQPIPPAQPIQEERPAANTFKEFKRFEWIGINIYYTAADEARFNDVEVTESGSSGTVEAEFSVETGIGFGASFMSMEERSWGFSGGVNFEPAREIKSVTFTGPGGTATGVLSSTKMSVLFFEGNAIYRWDKFYLPFGLNFSIPRLTSPSSSTVDIKGSVGAFVGAGFLLNDNCALELFARSIGFNMTEKTSTTTIDYGYGALTGAGLGFKFLF